MCVACSSLKLNYSISKTRWAYKKRSTIQQNRGNRSNHYKQTMPKYQERSSSTSKANEVAPQANVSPTETPKETRTKVMQSDFLEAIKELQSNLKGDNDPLRKTMISIRQEMRNKLNILTEEGASGRVGGWLGTGGGMGRCSF